MLSQLLLERLSGDFLPVLDSDGSLGSNLSDLLLLVLGVGNLSSLGDHVRLRLGELNLEGLRVLSDLELASLELLLLGLEHVSELLDLDLLAGKVNGSNLQLGLELSNESSVSLSLEHLLLRVRLSLSGLNGDLDGLLNGLGDLLLRLLNNDLLNLSGLGNDALLDDGASSLDDLLLGRAFLDVLDSSLGGLSDGLDDSGGALLRRTLADDDFLLGGLLDFAHNLSGRSSLGLAADLVLDLLRHVLLDKGILSNELGADNLGNSLTTDDELLLSSSNVTRSDSFFLISVGLGSGDNLGLRRPLGIVLNLSLHLQKSFNLFYLYDSGYFMYLNKTGC